jgi:phage minor structural protein
LSGKVFKSYEINASLTNAVKLALNETGWTYKNVSCSDTAIRNMSENNTTALDVLGKIAESYFCEISFSAKEKTVYLYDKIKKAKGYTPKFIRGLNLKSLEVKIDTNDFFTGILPIGADDLTIEDVNDGSKYLYNFQYSSIKKVLIWEDTNYTDAQSLKDAAELKLAEISTPTVTYTASILDLANIDDKYNGYAFDLGDEAVVQDPDIEVSDCQRILKITRYPDKPEKNTIELSSRKTSFSDLQKKILAAVDSVTNVTNGKIVIGSKVEGISANQIDGLEIYYNEPISNLEIDEICK